MVTGQQVDGGVDSPCHEENNSPDSRGQFLSPSTPPPLPLPEPSAVSPTGLGDDEVMNTSMTSSVSNSSTSGALSMPALATTSPNLDDDDDNDFIGDDVYEMQGDFKHSPLAAYLSCSEEKADLENEDAETEIVSNLYACVINYYICFLC